MTAIVLVVEDNSDVLMNLKMTLEFNGYQVLTADNGKKGIGVLENQDALPDLILSDIMMPEMNGYDFFTEVSKNPKWAQIPFLFLTARADPEDVRFGKMLGIDDYLTKPYDEETLLATIKGKITRHKTIRAQIEDMIARIGPLTTASVTDQEKSTILLIHMIEDKVKGPIMDSFMARELDPNMDLQEVGIQLFRAVSTVYGDTRIKKGQGLLIQMENWDKTAYVYFDAKRDSNASKGIQKFMLSVVAPAITYYDSLYLKAVLGRIALQLKAKRKWHIKRDWEDITEILSHAPFEL